MPGILYPPGDYDAAVAAIQRLIADPAHAAVVAAGGREEVERWGWAAATRNLRLIQYKRAIRNQRAHKRFGLLALRQGLRRLVRFCNLASLLAAVIHCLDYAHPFRDPPAATATCV